jgi:hypothetical protein
MNQVKIEWRLLRTQILISKRSRASPRNPIVSKTVAKTSNNRTPSTGVENNLLIPISMPEPTQITIKTII